MKYLSVVLLAFSFLVACNNSCEKPSGEEQVVNADVVADSESKLALEGMVCSMGCVSAIQNELRSTNGVAFAEVNYEESFATIKYDSKLVSEAELIAAIEGIGDHSYKAWVFEEANEEKSDSLDVELLETTQEPQDNSSSSN
ncbi:MAG: heavy-metal-associated domain-containing protein [Chitinophagales bacterium]|nr:heavy-metal-associated domain-containing protein [Chitinophagales bacterium]